MSELKAYNSERIYWAVEQVEREAGDIDTLHLDDNLFYLKDDADKVIAEKDAEIRKLNFQMWSARCEAAEAECDEPRLARCRYMADKFKEAK